MTLPKMDENQFEENSNDENSSATGSIYQVLIDVTYFHKKGDEGQDQLLSSDGYLYNLVLVGENKNQWQCINFANEKCPSAVTQTGNLYALNQTHNHPPNGTVKQENTTKGKRKESTSKNKPKYIEDSFSEQRPYIPDRVTYHLGASSRGGEQLTSSDGYAYNILRRNKNGDIKWQCVIRNGSLKCYALLTQSGDYFTLNQQHVHDPDPFALEKSIIRKQERVTYHVGKNSEGEDHLTSSDGFSYDLLSRNQNGEIKWQCAKTDESCPALMTQLKNRFILNQTHNHESDPDALERSILLDDDMPRIASAKYTQQALDAAIRAVKSGDLTQTKAAIMYNIPKSTLNDKLLGKAIKNINPGPEKNVKKQFEDFCHKEYLNPSESTTSKTISQAKGKRIVTYISEGIVEKVAANVLNQGPHDPAKFKGWVNSKSFKVVTDPDSEDMELYINEGETDKRVVFVEEFWNVLKDMHINEDEHYSAQKTMQLIHERYYGIPPEVVQRFIQYCPICHSQWQQGEPKTFNPSNCPLVPLRQFTNKVHSSVRIGGTEFSFKPAFCVDATCNTAETDHCHCPLCPVNVSFLDQKNLTDHYFNKHLTSVCADFSGMVMLRCYDYCYCIRSGPHVLLFGAGHWHCFGCNMGFRTKSLAIRHYRTHINKAEGSLQVRVSDDINSDCPMRSSEILKAEWLTEAERLSLRGQMEGTEEINEINVLEAENDKEDMSSFFTLKEVSNIDSMNDDDMNGDMSNQQIDNGFGDEDEEEGEESVDGQSIEELQEHIKSLKYTISAQKRQIAVYESAVGNISPQKNVSFEKSMQNLMADIQKKHMTLMQHHREEMEDFMDEQLNRISQAVIQNQETTNIQQKEVPNDIKDSPVKSKRGRKPGKRSITVPSSPSKPIQNKKSKDNKPVTSTPLPKAGTKAANGTDDTEDQVEESSPTEITEESGKRKSGRKRLNQKSALELLDLTPRSKRQHRGTD